MKTQLLKAQQANLSVKIALLILQLQLRSKGIKI